MINLFNIPQKIKFLIFNLFCTLLSVTAYTQPSTPKYSALYEDDNLARIDITISQSDIDYILAPGNEQSDEEFPATFKFQSNTRSDIEENVGFRLRGNTSRNAAKKSFKVSFNSFEKGRDLDGFEKFNLNGEHNDPTIIRSKLCWDMMAEIGAIASRVNHVELYINDEYKGLYINVEHIDEEFIEERFGNKDGNLYKCLWPADLFYRGDDQNAYKEENSGRRAYELKTNEEEDDYSGLANFIKILNQAPKLDFEEEISKVFDVDSYLRALAVEVLAAHWDNYGMNQNNYYLYDNPEDGKFYYIPYDLDNTLGVDWFDQDWAEWNIYEWYFDSRPLTKRILEVESFRNSFSNHIHQLLQNSFNPTHLNPKIDELKSLLQDAAERDTYRTLDYGWSVENFNTSFANRLENFHVRYGLKEYISRRYETALNQLERFDPLSSNQKVKDYSVYPNPSKNHLSFQLNNSYKQGTVSVYTLDGQEVMSTSFTEPAFEIAHDLDQGVYLLRILSDKQLLPVRKIIVTD